MPKCHSKKTRLDFDSGHGAVRPTARCGNGSSYDEDSASCRRVGLAAGGGNRAHPQAYLRHTMASKAPARSMPWRGPIDCAVRASEVARRVLVAACTGFKGATQCLRLNRLAPNSQPWRYLQYLENRCPERCNSKQWCIADSFFVPAAIRACLEGREVVVDRPDDRRDLVHVADVVDALQRLAAAAPPGASILNIARARRRGPPSSRS